LQFMFIACPVRRAGQIGANDLAIAKIAAATSESGDVLASVLRGDLTLYALTRDRRDLGLLGIIGDGW